MIKTNKSITICMSMNIFQFHHVSVLFCLRFARKRLYFELQVLINPFCLCQANLRISVAFPFLSIETQYLNAKALKLTLISTIFYRHFMFQS